MANHRVFYALSNAVGAAGQTERTKSMSAFVVSHDHIDALLSFASKRDTYGTVSYYVKETGRRVDITTENATEVGRILLTENERSIYARYTDCRPGDDNKPGTIGEDEANYAFRPWPFNAPLSAVSILKACSCFDYQACETDDYEDSLAATIIEAIRGRAINRLPGYDDAPGWEFSRARALSRKAG